MNLDELELELRRLPGVIATAFDVHESSIYVQLHVAGNIGSGPGPGDAARIAARHTDRPVEIEIVRTSARTNGAAGVGDVRRMIRFEHDELVVDLASIEARDDASGSTAPWSSSARPRLLAVLSFPESDELEVHVVHEGRRTIGRSQTSRGLDGAVEATIDALRQLGASTTAHTRWARTVDHDRDAVLVAVAIDGVVADAGTHYGLAAGSSPIDAAARSTLDAVNRRLARLL